MQFIALSLYLSIYLIENIGYLREGFNKKAMSFLFTLTNKEQILPQICQQYYPGQICQQYYPEHTFYHFRKEC